MTLVFFVGSMVSFHRLVLLVPLKYFCWRSTHVVVPRGYHDVIVGSPVVCFCLLSVPPSAHVFRAIHGMCELDAAIGSATVPVHVCVDCRKLSFPNSMWPCLFVRHPLGVYRPFAIFYGCTAIAKFKNFMTELSNSIWVRVFFMSFVCFFPSRLAYLRFTSKLDEMAPFRRWLQVEPAFALLTPGERAEFKISVFVDRLTARVRLCAP